MTDRLLGKNVLLTGATGALGQRFAHALAKEGANLVITSRTKETLDTLQQQLTARGIEVANVVADLEHTEDALRLADEAWAAFGRVDVVINSARARDHKNHHGGTVLTTNPATWRWFQELVVWNPLEMTNGLVTNMINSGVKGSVINIISHAGLTPHPGVDAYGLAKGSLALLTEYQAREWGVHGIRANALTPGHIVPDEEHREWAIATAEAMGMKNALGRLGEPHEMLGALIYLASDESTYFTGQIMTVCGGRYA